MSAIAFVFSIPTEDSVSVLAWAGALLGSLFVGLVPIFRGKLGDINRAAIAGFVIFGLFLISGVTILVLRYRAIGVTLDEKMLFLHQIAFGSTLFFALLTGMVLKYFHELNKAGKKFTEAKFMELWAPITVSVLIFFTVWGAVGGKPIDFLSVGLAIQNGFFWQDVLGRITPPAAAAPALPS